MNVSQPVTNEMLYELLKEFKKDVDRRFNEQEKRMDQRFNEQEKRMDQRFDEQDNKFGNFRLEVNRRFDEQEKRMEAYQRESIRKFADNDRRMDQQDSRMSRMERKIDEIHETRHEVRVKFSWKLAMAGIAMSTGVSLFVVFVTDFLGK